MSETLLPLAVVIPLAGGGVALAGKFAGRRGGRIMSIVAVASLAACGAVLAVAAPAMLRKEVLHYALGGWPEPFGISLVMDGFAWLSAALSVAIALPVGIAALSRNRYPSLFFFFLLLLVAGMISVSLTGDLFTMFVSFEIVAISAYVLIAFDRSTEGLVASFKYLVLSSVGILFFLFGVFLVYRDMGVLSIGAVSSAIRAAPALGDLPAMHLALAAICVGIGVRTAFVPFHTWLPEAHAYAPTPVSALLSGALIKISIFAMMRILRAFSGAYLNELLLWIGGATAVLAVVVALAQSDAKRLLAYHSVSQMGYVLAAFAAAGGISAVASMAHAISHAFFKSLLFLTVGAAIDLTGSRDLYRMTPLGRRAPLLALFYLVGALSIAGLPPFNGYVSKALVLDSVSGSPVHLLLWITGAATIASFIKLSRIFAPAAAPPGERPTNNGRPGFLLLIACGALAAACVLGGVAGRPLAVALHRLAGTGPMPAFPGLYSTAKLLSTGGALAAGIVLYLLAVSVPGKRVAGALKRYAPDLRSVLLLFLVGLVAFGAVAYL